MIPEPDSSPAFLPSAALSAKIRGCLLGGALGDARAHASVGSAVSGTSITADTQLALYSLDGLLEAIEWANEGVGADETACIWLAYLRWLRGRGVLLPESGPTPLPRPIDSKPLLQPAGTDGGADLDPDVVSALSTGEMGTRQRPLNTDANTPAALVRSAPFGLLPYVGIETAYKLALDAASLTHGHPSARHSAAVFASLVHGLLAPGATLGSAAAEALVQARANGAPELADQLQAVLDDDGGADAAGPGAGAPTAEAALAIGLRAALGVEDAAGTAEAIRQAAAAGGAPAAVVTGSLLGTRYGTPPEPELEALRERGVIEDIASGFIAATIAR